MRPTGQVRYKQRREGSKPRSVRSVPNNLPLRANIFPFPISRTNGCVRNCTFKWKLAFLYNWRDEITTYRREEATEESRRGGRATSRRKQEDRVERDAPVGKGCRDAARRGRSGGESPLPAERVLSRFKAYSDTGVVYAPNAVI